MEQAEVEIAVGELESRVDRLRALYDQYFMGIEKLEPSVARKDVERRFYTLRKEQIRNTALRFRFQMLVQRYSTYQNYWQRICREIENGTYRRHVLRAQKRFGDDAAKSARGGAREELKTDPPPGPKAFELDELSAWGADEPPTGSIDVSLDFEVDDAFGALEDPVSRPPSSAPFRAAPPVKPAQPPPASAANAAPIPAPTAPRAPMPPAMNAPSQRPTIAAQPSPSSAFATRPPPLGALPARPPGAASMPPPGSSPHVNGPPTPGPQRIWRKAAPSPPRGDAASLAPPPPAQAPTANRGAPPRAMGAPTQGASPPIAAPRAPAPAASSPVARRSSGDPDLPDDRVRQLYAQYVETKRRQNESTAAITYDGLAKSLRESSAKLRAKHGKSVDFEVTVKDGKTVIKPVVK